MSEAKQDGGAARVKRGGKRAEAERGSTPRPRPDVVDLLEYRLRKTLEYVQQHGTLKGVSR